MQAYSLDLRERVGSASEKGTVTRAALAARFSVGQPLVKKRLRQQRETGSWARVPQRAGAQKKLAASQRKWLALPVKAVPDLTRGELPEQ